MSEDRSIKRIAIVGGGTAGWMAASILARALPGTGCVISVIESPEVGTVGVGEATIPPIIDLLHFLNIDAADFVKRTQATYKLGIKFRDWNRPGIAYWHPFGAFGAAINLRPFHHAWARARAAGLAPRFNDFSLAATLGDAEKFRFPDPATPGAAAGLRHALHFDAGLVAAYLATYAQRLGVTRLVRTVAHAPLAENGFIKHLVFSDGSCLEADLYVDCSGFRGVLIEGALATGYVDWTHLLPCDRALAMPTQSELPRPPFTEACALRAGWRWRIPLQHRVGNGYVYSSRHLSDDAALAELTAQLGAAGQAEPRLLRFTTGHRKSFWHRNCVALGLASGFLEPLESTSIHLVMSGVYKLLQYFPDRNFAQRNIDSYNRELTHEIEHIRDFLVLHYCLNQRTEDDFWNDCRGIALPESLRERIDLYRQTGRIRPTAGELFTDSSWFYVFEGMGLIPDSYDPLLDVVPLSQLREILGSLAQANAQVAAGAYAHDSFFSPAVQSNSAR